MLLPLCKLVLDKFDLLKKFYFCAFLLSDSCDNFESKLVAMLALHSVRLVSVHRIVDILVFYVFIR